MTSFTSVWKYVFGVFSLIVFLELWLHIKTRSALPQWIQVSSKWFQSAYETAGVNLKNETFYTNRSRSMLQKSVTKSPTVSLSLTKKPLPVGISLASNTRIRLYDPANVTRTDFHQYFLRSPKGTLELYGYDTKDYISRSIKNTGNWEGSIIKGMIKLLERDPKLHLLDIGCNIGVYTLAVAKLGRKVLAVDANVENLARLRKSLLTNHLADKVTLVWNAIDQTYTTVKMVIGPQNVGGGYVVDIKQKNANRGSEVTTITLDDLLKVINKDIKKAVMKIDIEGKEFAALHNASRLFSEIDITVVMMEWGIALRDYKHKPSVLNFIVNFFQRRAYQAFARIEDVKPLTTQYIHWPWDIILKKK